MKVEFIIIIIFIVGSKVVFGLNKALIFFIQVKRCLEIAIVVVKIIRAAIKIKALRSQIKFRISSHHRRIKDAWSHRLDALILLDLWLILPLPFKPLVKAIADLRIWIV